MTAPSGRPDRVLSAILPSFTLRQGVALQDWPADAGVAGLVPAALFGAEDHLGSPRTGRVTRASVFVFGGGGSCALIDLGPFVERRFGAEARQRHAGVRRHGAAGVFDVAIGGPAERDDRDGTRRLA